MGTQHPVEEEEIVELVHHCWPLMMQLLQEFWLLHWALAKWARAPMIAREAMVKRIFSGCQRLENFRFRAIFSEDFEMLIISEKCMAWQTRAFSKPTLAVPEQRANRMGDRARAAVMEVRRSAATTRVMTSAGAQHGWNHKVG